MNLQQMIAVGVFLLVMAAIISEKYTAAWLRWPERWSCC